MRYDQNIFDQVELQVSKMMFDGVISQMNNQTSLRIERELRRKIERIIFSNHTLFIYKNNLIIYY